MLKSLHGENVNVDLHCFEKVLRLKKETGIVVALARFKWGESVFLRDRSKASLTTTHLSGDDACLAPWKSPCPLVPSADP